MSELKNTLLDHEDQFVETFAEVAQLISNNNLQEAANILSSLHYADLADFLDNTNHKIYPKILPLLLDSIQAESLVFLNDSSKQPVIEAIGINKSATLIEELDLEDAIEVIDNIDEEIREEILNHLSAEKKNQIIEGFNYPEETVGRIIEKNFICFYNNWTVGQAIESIKNYSEEDDFTSAIVVDTKYRPVGNITLSKLLKYPPEKKLTYLLNPDLKVATPLTQISDITFIFKQYALTIVPVVNKNGKLIGAISINSMIYIIEQQAEKDIMQLGGVNSQDTFDNIFNTATHRFPWLFVNLITACITGIIINQFSHTISQIVTIAAIMPIVASMGGNAGTQAMTVTVRAIANKDINQANMLKVIVKEILVCSFNGLALAMIGFLVCMLMFPTLGLGSVFATSIILSFTVAGFLGAVIPISLHKLNIDPATASGVFLTTLTDILGFITFLSLAHIFLI